VFEAQRQPGVNRVSAIAEAFDSATAEVIGRTVAWVVGGGPSRGGVKNAADVILVGGGSGQQPDRLAAPHASARAEAAGAGARAGLGGRHTWSYFDSDVEAAQANGSRR
jgi:hypothetical protein